MSWLRDIVALYGRVFRRAAVLSVRHWWLGVVAIAYPRTLLGVAALVAPLGIVGGMLATVTAAALVSSWFVLVGYVVRDGRATLADVSGSFVVYLGDVLTFGFLLWVLSSIGTLALSNFSYLAIVFLLAVLVFLSAVPEQIYLGRESGPAVFIESYKFVAAYWIEWLPALLVFLLLMDGVRLVPFAPLALLVEGVLVAFMFIGRGLLFLELTTSSRRSREFQRRVAE